jgi:quercetin dioxygenase-like cupin family protein
MRRTLLLLVAAMLALLVPIAAAPASPPSGRFTFRDLARAEIAGPGTVRMVAGTDVFTSSYELAPGATTGWRTLPGTSILAVTAGTMAVRSTEGCAAAGHRTGSAAVLGAGQHLVHNPGSEPLRFVAVFFHLPQPGPSPLLDGPAEPAPAGCEAEPPAGGTAARLDDTSRGTFAALEQYYGHPPSTDTVELEPRTDVLVSFYRLEPGTSFGWHTHAQPSLAVLTKGTVTYYEGHQGRCVVSGVYGAGDAYYTIPGEGHRHLAAVTGSEPVEVYGIFLNVPEKKYPVPIFGN